MDRIENSNPSSEQVMKRDCSCWCWVSVIAQVGYKSRQFSSFITPEVIHNHSLFSLILLQSANTFFYISASYDLQLHSFEPDFTAVLSFLHHWLPSIQIYINIQTPRQHHHASHKNHSSSCPQSECSCGM